MAKLRTVPGLVDIDTSTAQRKPEVRVYIDRRKAADLQVRANDIASSLRTLVAGEPVTKFREGAEQYDVWLRVRKEDRSSEAALYKLQIPSQTGRLVQLSSLVQLRDDMGPAQIDRLNRQRQVTLVGNLDGLPLGTAIDQVTKFADEIDMPIGYNTAPLGRAKIFAETGLNFAIAFLLSLVFMYMILAAQFESFLHPITIMLSLPLSIPFALVSLVIMADTLNLYSVIGVFMLFGIVQKERHSPSGLHQHATRHGTAARRGYLSRQSGASASYLNDHRHTHCRHDSYCVRSRRWRRSARLDGQSDHRWSGVVVGYHTSDCACGLCIV